MEIFQEDLVTLRHLQEDIAAEFCDDTLVSGECYWECVETLASIKLMNIHQVIQLSLLMGVQGLTFFELGRPGIR